MVSFLLAHQKKPTRAAHPFFLLILAAAQSAQYHLTALVVIDDHFEATPAAYFVTSALTAQDLSACIAAVVAKLRTVQADWQPSAFATDDADAELNAIKAVFPDVPVVLCIFHVKKAWINKLHEIGELRGEAKVATRARLRKALDEAMNAKDERAADAVLQKFYHDFDTLCPKFIKYFKSTWASNPARMRAYHPPPPAAPFPPPASAARFRRSLSRRAARFPPPDLSP